MDGLDAKASTICSVVLIGFMIICLTKTERVYGGTPLHAELKQSGRLTGRFPHLDYSGIDEQVELTYEICRDCFSPLLELAYETKRVERKTRLATLAQEQATAFDGDWNSENRIDPRGWNSKMLLSRIIAGINRDAASLFLEVLNLVAGFAIKPPAQELHAFKQTIGDHAARACVGWMNTLRFFEKMCLAGRNRNSLSLEHANR